MLAPVPLNSPVMYHGSQTHMHGEYTIMSYGEPLTWLNPGQAEQYYPDGVSYTLWPVGVPVKMGLSDRSLFRVRRESITVIQVNKEKETS